MSNTNQPRDKEAIPGILRGTLLNIFQIGNPDFFSHAEQVDISAGSIQVAHNLLKMAGSPFADHLAEKAPTQNITLRFGAEPEGSFIMFIDYIYPKSQGGDHRSLMIIGRNKQDGKETDLTQVAPHFIMTGYNTHADEGNDDIFIPQEMVCRMRFDGEENDCLVSASNDERILAAVCYADEAFRAIAAGEPIDMEANQDWLADDDMARAEAADRYLALKTRTLSGLEEEIFLMSEDAITKKEPTMPPRSFVIDGPSTLQ